MLSVVFTADDISVHHASGVWSEWRIAAEKLHDIVEGVVALQSHASFISACAFSNVSPMGYTTYKLCKLIGYASTLVLPENLHF